MINSIIDSLVSTRDITLEQLDYLLHTEDAEVIESLRLAAQTQAKSIYGNKIFVRGLIEFTNHCKNDCYYCGLRKSNISAERYRLDKATILNCCQLGYGLGFRTFVLQGGEDPYFTDELMCDIVSSIKKNHPDCAVTLSIGEKSRESYQRFYDAGADRYLLRHETANADHYAVLHPAQMSLQNRKECLFNLREIGFQVGCGFMVGSPGQTVRTLYEDLQFIKELQPHMVGIGPFIPEHTTPFAHEKAGTMEQTLRLLSIIRLIHPHVLLPATTALGTINHNGREQGILHGANVLMPNLSPKEARSKYLIYDNKICTGDEAAVCRVCLERRVQGVGYEIVTDRGDYKPEA